MRVTLVALLALLMVPFADPVLAEASSDDAPEHWEAAKRVSAGRLKAAVGGDDGADWYVVEPVSGRNTRVQVTSARPVDVAFLDATGAKVREVRLAPGPGGAVDSVIETVRDLRYVGLVAQDGRHADYALHVERVAPVDVAVTSVRIVREETLGPSFGNVVRRIVHVDVVNLGDAAATVLTVEAYTPGDDRTTRVGSDHRLLRPGEKCNFTFVWVPRHQVGEVVLTARAVAQGDANPGNDAASSRDTSMADLGGTGFSPLDPAARICVAVECIRVAKEGSGLESDAKAKPARARHRSFTNLGYVRAEVALETDWASARAGGGLRTPLARSASMGAWNCCS